MYPRKKPKTKIYFAVILIVVLVIAAGVAVYYAGLPTPPKPVLLGLNVGDTFTYSIKGTVTLFELEATIPEDFYVYNQTDFFRLTVIAVNDTKVSFDTLWRFLNGTEINREQTIDLSNGEKADPDGFWAVYASSLNVGEKLRPNGFDGLIVNKTDTQIYSDSSRARNFFEIQNEFFDARDPTKSTRRFDYISLFFDRETGVLESLTNLQSYNNPQMNLFITWKLTSSSVWKVE